MRRRWLVLALFLVLDQGASLRGQEGRPFLRRIRTAADFIEVSIPLEDVATVDRITKYLVPAVAEPDCPELSEPVFQNVRRYRLHYQFLVGEFPECFAGLSNVRYLELVAKRETRQYFAGSLSRLLTDEGTLFGFSVFTSREDSELLSPAEVGSVHLQLSEVFDLVEPGELYYAPDTAAAHAAAREWQDPGFPVYLGGVTESNYEAYTRAVGYGTVRRMTLAQFEKENDSGRITWQDILVLEKAPSDIEGVVSGVITAEPQGVLSHVAIRSARRGTPNAFLRDALEIFANLEGKLIRLDVRQTEYEAKEAPLDEARKFWEENRPQLSELPTVDGDYENIDSFDEMVLDGDVSPESRYGGKASNLARLQRMLDGPFERYREVGFAIPLYYYFEFIRSNRIESLLERGRFVTYEEYLQELFNLEPFQADPELRFAILADLRNHMEDEGRVDDGLVNRLAEKIEQVFAGRSIPVRFRSSSNVEDILEFNGAGLYDSTTACVLDQFDPDDEGPSLCDAEQRNERTIERALKRVWASLWNSRAYEERAYYRIPQELAGMGILVNRAFTDERANGVAFTGNPANVLDHRYLITAQVGEESVVSPRPGVLPERNVLIVDDEGKVLVIERAQRSTLAPGGEYVVSETILRELGALLFRIDRDFPLDLGKHSRDQVLFDIEFKVEASGELAVKQVRPFLVTQPPPASPTFELVVPESTVLCGGWVESRSPVEEFREKSQLRLASGTHRLPAAIETFFGGRLIDEVVFGPQKERLEPAGAGLYHVETLARGDGEVTYIFYYEQSFVAESGETFDFELRDLRFQVRAGEPVETVRVLTEEFAVDDLILTAMPDGDDGRLLRYSSCEYPTAPLWDVRAEIEGGARLRLEERFREAVSGNGPAALVRAELDVDGKRREVRDYWKLVYAAAHHNVNVRYMVVFDPLVSVSGTEGVRAIELAAPITVPFTPASAILRGDDLEVLAKPSVTSFLRCRPPDCPTGFRRGDANTDGDVNISDAIFLLRHIFQGSRASGCPDAADFDDNGVVESDDAIFVLSFLFRGIDLSAPPGPYECGFDPTPEQPTLGGCERGCL